MHSLVFITFLGTKVKKKGRRIEKHGECVPGCTERGGEERASERQVRERCMALVLCKARIASITCAVCLLGGGLMFCCFVTGSLSGCVSIRATAQ